MHVFFPLTIDLELGTKETRQLCHCVNRSARGFFCCFRFRLGELVWNSYENLQLHLHWKYCEYRSFNFYSHLSWFPVCCSSCGILSSETYVSMYQGLLLSLLWKDYADGCGRSSPWLFSIRFFPSKTNINGLVTAANYVLWNFTVLLWLFFSSTFVNFLFQPRQKASVTRWWVNEHAH